jgi:hypothetical protein
MSGLEQRTKGRHEALGVVSAVTAVIPRSLEEEKVGARSVPPVADWPAIDGDLLDERRAPVPAFPLELLAQPWRDWVSAAARSADVPVDYVAQSLLATVAGVSSRRVLVLFASGWLEPLQLWLAAVGAPSTGKSPALRLARRLLNALEREPIEGLDPAPREIVLEQPSLQGVTKALGKNQHGQLLWRDGPGGCFAPLRGMPDARHLESLTVSLLGSVEPEGVWRALPPGGEGLTARFLYAWPHAASFSPLRERVYASGDDVLVQLRRLFRLSTRGRCVLSLDASGLAAFDAFLSRLHGAVRQADGSEAAWLGKGRGAVACLAATFALMDWSATEATREADEPPRLIAADAVERAVSLWSDYYHPHARAFLQSAVPTDVDGQARRVARWLRDERRSVVSRTEVRRTALGRTVDARGAERVVARLVEAGVLQPLASEKRPQGGRPMLRWQVNPMLAAAQG